LTQPGDYRLGGAMS